MTFLSCQIVKIVAMIRSFTILLLCLCAFGVAAQRVTMKNGNVLKNDSVYCLYETDNYEYPAYIFSTKDKEQLVFADARDLSTVSELYMVHYYCISFPQLGEEFSIRFHPYRMQYFIEDLVKYDVFREGRWNPDGAEALIKAWSKKMDILSPEKIAGGTSIYSNPANNHATGDSLLAGISFHDDNIYRGDSVIGRYRINKEPVKEQGVMQGQFFYAFYDLKGNRLARITAPGLRSVAYIKMEDEEKSLAILCPDKSELKMLRVATGILLLRGLL